MRVSRILTAALVLAGGALSQATHKIVNSFASPHGGNYMNGIAYARGQLWTCSGSGAGAGTIYRLDAYTGAVLGNFKAPSTSLRGMTHDGGFLWVASWSNNTVYRLIDVTGQSISSFQAFVNTGRPDGLAWDGKNLLISDERNKIHWFNQSGTSIRSINVPASGAFNPRDLGWDGTHVWAGYQSSGRIRRHNPTTGAVVLDIPSPSGAFQQGLEWADWYLWVGGGRNAKIYQIDIGAPYLELVGTPSWPNQIQFKLTEGQKQAGDVMVVLLSGSGVAGFSAGGVTVPLTYDTVTGIGITLLPYFVATVDASGVALTPKFSIPPLAAGITLWAAAATAKGNTVTSVTDPIRFKTR
ncbi:MAG: glutaminyl-peptide cyclotransferase [Planctomycetota bacterium]|jgi:glutamine cyclotransferase